MLAAIEPSQDYTRARFLETLISGYYVSPSTLIKYFLRCADLQPFSSPEALTISPPLAASSNFDYSYNSTEPRKEDTMPEHRAAVCEDESTRNQAKEKTRFVLAEAAKFNCLVQRQRARGATRQVQRSGVAPPPA